MRFAPRRPVGLVEGEVEGRAGAVVLAHGVDRRRVASSSAGTRPAARVEDLAAAVEIEPVGVGADQPLRQVEGLREEEPVPVAEREIHVGAAEVLARRHDVEDGEPAHALRMVERHAVGDPPAAVVAGDREALMPERRITATLSRAIARFE